MTNSNLIASKQDIYINTQLIILNASRSMPAEASSGAIKCDS